METNQYRIRDMVYAFIRLPFMGDAEKAALRRRAEPLDDTWTVTEQLASERYQLSRVQRATEDKSRERRKYFRNPFK
jgi:hypothetical protein